MANALCTFMNIFKSDIELEDTEKNFVRPQKIIIPIIQRDYAQGRNNLSVNRVRKNFLDALYKAVTEKPIILDFVYGDIDDNGILTPLDGQQRLTTLFLLHWYAAKKENISPTETNFLEKFSYETRPDSREFCARLINFKPQFNHESLSAEIENQAWFPLSWKKDPTVSSMLNMLDDINKKFFNVKNLWEKLKNNAISFYFLPVKNMGLTDEIYITMNSRGKPLTDFEHFKAEFKSRLDLIDADYSTKIIRKIDTVWTDLLWQYRDEKNLIDSGFLNYFRFLCNVLLYKRNGTTQGKNRNDAFLLLDEFFSGSADDILANVQFMEKSFDCWLDKDIDKFFDDRISCGSKRNKTANKHAPGKIIVYYNENNIFKNCLETNHESFSLGKLIMLYAVLVYLKSQNISDEDFRRRIRIVNNLVINSADSEISDSETRQGGNRIPTMLKQVENIITTGKILTGIGPNFNDYQITEEIEKISWLEKNPDKSELLFTLEDHYLLYGQIGIVGLEYPNDFQKFISLFKCDYDKICRALLIEGDYLQQESNGWRYQLGSNKLESWQNLFHKSSNERYSDTQETLSKIFYKTKNFSDEILDKIISKYLSDCKKNLKFDWIYYYVKYEIFRLAPYGKYWWRDFENNPYELIALNGREKTSRKSYQPFLKAVDKNDNISPDDGGQSLNFGDCYVECENDCYVVKDLVSDITLKRLKIKQRNGVDIEDRILKFKRWAKGYLY